MQLKFYPEPQGQAVREAYLAMVPTEVFDRLMEIRHAVQHGTITYSHPASEALQDWFEVRLSRLAMEMKNAKDGEERERLQARIDGAKLQRALIAFGQSRKLGFTAPKEFAPMLTQIYSQEAMFRTIGEFIHLSIVPDHRLEDCPNPD